MNLASIVCHKCRHVWEFAPPLGRRETCPKCRADARVCLNCRFYDRMSYRECREEQAEWVKEKESGNFCSYFTASATGRSAATDAELAKAKLDHMFGKGEDKNADPSSSASQTAQSNTKANLKAELEKFLQSKK